MHRVALIESGLRLEEKSKSCLAMSKALKARAHRLRAKSDERVRVFWTLWRRHEDSPRGALPGVTEARADTLMAPREQIGVNG